MKKALLTMMAGLILVVVVSKDIQVKIGSYIASFRFQINEIVHPSSPAIKDMANKLDLVRVKYAIDGDTIELESGEKIRYVGMNTPESVHPKKPIECFGHEASAANKKLVEGKYVHLEKDVSDTDKYGRFLRYVFVYNLPSTTSAIFANAYLVGEGYAQVMTIPPDTKYHNYFQQLQDKAIANKKGMWAKCLENNIGK
jgi:micrococcal nuclease